MEPPLNQPDRSVFGTVRLPPNLPLRTSEKLGGSLALPGKPATEPLLKQRHFPFLAALCLALLTLGCHSSGPIFTHDPIVQINLITAPVALDFDGQPGPDGISVKVYANSANEPKPVPIRGGTLELLLFDGPFRQQYTPPVLKTFRFPASELRAHEFRANIGAGYAFALAWGTNLPTQRTMSVAARYTSPTGQIVLSRPSSITVLSQ